jgi:DNA oxidative demethylase
MSKKKIIRVKEPPPGLFYIPGFLRVDEEQEFLRRLTEESFNPVFHQGFLAKREAIFYGAQGGYKGKEDEDGGPIPAWIEPLRDRCARLIGLNNDELEMALVANYPAGAGIGWHRDAPQFGPTVIGVSFGSDAQLRFRRFVDDMEELFRLNVEHGSAYIMSGPSRTVWQHGMSPVSELRYSITFRTVNSSSKKKSPQSRHEPENIAERLAQMNIEDGLKSTSGAEHKQLSLF